jgi:hypothetical protein
MAAMETPAATLRQGAVRLDHDHLGGHEPAGAQPTVEHRVAHVAAAHQDQFDAHDRFLPFACA